MGKSLSSYYFGAIMTENNQDQKTVAIQTIYVKDVSFEAPNSPGVFMEENISPKQRSIYQIPIIKLEKTHMMFL